MDKEIWTGQKQSLVRDTRADNGKLWHSEKWVKYYSRLTYTVILDEEYSTAKTMVRGYSMLEKT